MGVRAGRRIRKEGGRKEEEGGMKENTGRQHTVENIMKPLMVSTAYKFFAHIFFVDLEVDILNETLL